MLTTFTDKGDSHVIDLNDIVAWYLITLALGFITTSLRISIKLSPKNKERMCMEDYLIVGGTLSSMVIAAIIVALGSQRYVFLIGFLEADNIYIVNSDLMVIKDHVLTTESRVTILKACQIIIGTSLTRTSSLIHAYSLT